MSDTNTVEVVCTKCHRLQIIEISEPLQITVVMEVWARELGGLCKECLKEQDGKANQSSNIHSVLTPA